MSAFTPVDLDVAILRELHAAEPLVFSALRKRLGAGAQGTSSNARLSKTLQRLRREGTIYFHRDVDSTREGWRLRRRAR